MPFSLMTSQTAMNGTSSKGGGLDGVVFRVASPAHYPEVMRLMYANFFTDEPMSSRLKIYDGVNTVKVLDDYSYEALGENLSLVALDEKTEQLLGEKQR